MSLELQYTPSSKKDDLIKKLGRYEILSELGKGAMGNVYKAVDPLIDRIVAIKTINLNLPKDEIAVFEERFHREAKSVGRLNHPNIVTVYDVGRTDEIAYMAMEYLEGRELKEIISSNQIPHLDRITEIIAQIADALAFAHDRGIVHRDIKPANIMVLHNGAVKITDFGIAATPSSTQTQAGTILGSPKYMSPEQVSGKPVDGRSDIFSLGVVLYEMLTGVPAFGGANSSLAAVMYQIMNETPDPPTIINPSIPTVFDFILAKALAKEPKRRYQSARDMADDLRNFKTLKISARLRPMKKSYHLSKRDRVATLVSDIIKKLTITARTAFTTIKSLSLRKKLIGAVIITIIVLATALFINARREPVKMVAENKKIVASRKASAPVTKRQSSTATKGKSANSEAKARKKTNVAAPATASVNFTILPWGEVFIDGKKRGVSPPLKQIKLSPGKHKIEIRNANFAPYRETVKLKAEENIKIRYKFK